MGEVYLPLLFTALYFEVRVKAMGGDMDHIVPFPPYILRGSKRVYERFGTTIGSKPLFIKL